MFIFTGNYLSTVAQINIRNFGEKKEFKLKNLNDFFYFDVKKAVLQEVRRPHKLKHPYAKMKHYLSAVSDLRPHTSTFAFEPCEVDVPVVDFCAVPCVPLELRSEPIEP